jgi:hypothetical protein
VLLYYGTLQKGEKAAALDLVAPESMNDFFRMNYDGLVEFRILDVRLSDAGDTATVRLLRTDRFVGFPQLLDHQTVDTWRRIDGRWYVLLPTQKKELDTPFGKMTFPGRGENMQQATSPILLHPVDPEEARKAFEKALLEASKQKPEDKDTKPGDKRSEDQTVPKQKPQN